MTELAGFGSVAVGTSSIIRSYWRISTSGLASRRGGVTETPLVGGLCGWPSTATQMLCGNRMIIVIRLATRGSLWGPCAAKTYCNAATECFS